MKRGLKWVLCAPCLLFAAIFSVLIYPVEHTDKTINAIKTIMATIVTIVEFLVKVTMSIVFSVIIVLFAVSYPFTKKVLNNLRKNKIYTYCVNIFDYPLTRKIKTEYDYNKSKDAM